jgi:threonine dehydratase
MIFFADRMKIVVEPTGCLAAAAVFTGKIGMAGQRCGILVSGGNVDIRRFSELLGNAGRSSSPAPKSPRQAALE